MNRPVVNNKLLMITTYPKQFGALNQLAGSGRMVPTVVNMDLKDYSLDTMMLRVIS